MTGKRECLSTVRVMADGEQDAHLVCQSRNSDWDLIYTNASAIDAGFPVCTDQPRPLPGLLPGSDEDVWMRALSEAQVMGQAVFQSIVAGTLDGTRAAVAKRLPDGTVWVRIRTASNPSMAEDVMAYESVIRQLRDRERRLRCLFDQHPHAVFEMDAEGRIVAVNERGAALVNATVEDLQGRSVVPAISHDYTKISADFRRALQGEAGTYVHSVRHPEGSLLHVKSTLIPILMDDRVAGVYAISEDVTEQQRVQTRLQQSEENYRRIVEYSPAGMVVHSHDIILFANPAAVQVLGAATDVDLIGRHIRDVIDPEFHEFAQARLSHLAEGSTLPTAEYRLRKLGGAPFYAELTSMHTTLDGRVVTITLIRDVTSEKETEQALYELAFFDPLTNLPNRRLFRRELDLALARAQRNDGKFAILFLDCDHFKMVNDRFGHEFGDRVLIGIAARLQDTVRAGDIVSRMGGDEFLVMLSPIDDLAEAEHAAARIAEAMCQPWEVAGEQVTIPVSIGITCYPDDGSDPDALLRQADTAMYTAKRKMVDPSRKIARSTQMSPNTTTP